MNEWNKHKTRQTSTNKFVSNREEQKSSLTEKHNVEDVSTIKEALERLEDVKGHLEKWEQGKKIPGGMNSRNSADNEVLELRARCQDLEQQIEKLNTWSKVDGSNHTVIASNTLQAKYEEQESVYQDLLNGINKDTSENNMQLLKTKDVHSEAQEIERNKKLNSQSREKVFALSRENFFPWANKKDEIWNGKPNSIKINASIVEVSEEEPLFSGDQGKAATPEKLDADESQKDSNGKLEDDGSAGMLVISKTLRIVRFIQKEDWSQSNLDILKELENELEMVRKILFAKEEMIEDLKAKIGVEKATISVLTKVLENQNSVVPRIPFRENDTRGGDEFQVNKDYEQEKAEPFYNANSRISLSNSVKSESDLRDPYVKSPFTSNFNAQYDDQDVAERRRSLAETRRLLELEHRRLSTTSTSSRLEAETRRRSSVSAEQYSQTNPMDDKKKYDHQLVSVLSRSHSNVEELDDVELNQLTPANSPTASPRGVAQNVGGADILVSKEIPIKDQTSNNHIFAKQWNHIYKVQRKLKNLETKSQKEIEIYKRQLALHNRQERPLKDNSIKSEVIAWKEKYWKVAYSEQKLGKKIDELQEELEETKIKLLEANRLRSSYEPKGKAVLTGGSNMNDDEFESVVQLIETVSENHSHELMELHRENDIIVGELQNKFQQIVHENNDLALELAERTKELKQCKTHKQTVSNLKTQLEVTQSSLHSKQNEVSEMKKIHGKIVSDIKMSKLEFIKQSVVEIERLKLVIRSYNSKLKNPTRSVANSWLTGWV